MAGPDVHGPVWYHGKGNKVKAIRVLLADDHALVRGGVRALIQLLPDFEVVAEAGNGQEVLPLVKTHRPNIALLDITMPGLNGLEVAERLRKEAPEVHVGILSMHTNEEYVLRALQVGVLGYLLKDTSAEEFALALKTIAQGQTYLSPAVAKHVIADYRQRVSTKVALGVQLTPRQREVLQLVAEGRSNKEISQLLDISLRTVETHRTQLMNRLEIHDVPGLVRYAIRTGLVTQDM